MERCGCIGTSDPYVKFKVDGKTCYRSRTVMRNLNPKWDEKFSVLLEDLGKTIDVRVYDYDRGLRDDWMGSAAIHPALLQLNVYATPNYRTLYRRPHVLGKTKQEIPK